MGSQPWLDAGVPRPRGWPRGPRACRVALDWSLPPLEVLGPEQVHQGLWHTAPCIRCCVVDGVGFLQPPCLTSRLPPLWTLALSVAGRPLQLWPPLASSPLGLGLWMAQGPSAHSPGPTMPSASPTPGALGQRLGLSPARVLDQAKASHYAKAAQGGPMGGKVGTGRPPSPSPAGCDS